MGRNQNPTHCPQDVKWYTVGNSIAAPQKIKERITM
jgi:hypothetical protein